MSNMKREIQITSNFLPLIIQLIVTITACNSIHNFEIKRHLDKVS